MLSASSAGGGDTVNQGPWLCGAVTKGAGYAPLLQDPCFGSSLCFTGLRPGVQETHNREQGLPLWVLSKDCGHASSGPTAL